MKNEGFLPNHFYLLGLDHSGIDLYSSSSDWMPYPLNIPAIFLDL
jgi:hypothetical protein